MSAIVSVTPNQDRRPLDSALYPLLSKIDSPADLRRLTVDQLPALCDEIRAFLIRSLAENPGHFASSMGAVELTVALHYVFDTPDDRIVWDVGHQAYAHKLLTGRAPLFHTNRKLGGLSGFPFPAESPYDTFAAGHASNSISAALGMAVASAADGSDTPNRNVVAVIGDASISGGLAFEGLNNAANSRSNLLIVLNDNDMSIDRNVGSLNSYLGRMTASRPYNAVRGVAYHVLKGLRLYKDENHGRMTRFHNSLKSFITRETNIFEGLSIRYFGPVNGNDIRLLVRVFTELKSIKGPRLLHLRTLKGKGYKPAEVDPAHWHAPGRFDPATGERDVDKRAMSPAKYQDVFGSTLVELARTNPDIVGITAAMLSGTSMSMLKAEMPGRTFDVGISEGHAVTFAAGLAREGKRPVVAIYSSFLQRAYDQIVHDVALQQLPVVFAIDRAGIVGEDGATHHGALDLAYLTSVPGLTVAAPRDEIYLRHLLFTALSPQWEGPIAIRYPRGSGEIEQWRQPMHALPVGKGEKLADGTDAIILSAGTVASDVAKAIEAARAEGISVGHYDMIFVKPLDTSILAEVAATGLPIITVEDGTLRGGFSSGALEWWADNGYTPRVRRLGMPDKFVPHGRVAELKKICGIDADSILNEIRNITSPRS